MKPAARSSRYALLAGFGVLLALLVATTVLGVTRTDLLVVIGALAAAAAILIAVFVTRHVRRVEYALQLENELAQVTLHSIGDGVITTDSQGRVEYLNPVAEQYTGWTTAEARGRPVTEVYRVIDERSGQPLDALERPPEPASEGRGSGVGAARSAQRPRVSDPLLARADPQPGGAGARHAGMKSDAMDYAIVDAINRISHILGMQTVAEEVEDAETLAKLTALKIDYAQGYFIAEPEAMVHGPTGQLVELESA